LAAEYAGRLERLEKRAAKAENGDLSQKEIDDLQRDVARLSRDIGTLGAMQGKQKALSQKVQRLEQDVKALKADVARLNARQVQLTLGLGGNAMLAPEIPEHVGSATLVGVADIGITVQDRKSSWVLSTEFGLAPDHGYSLGGYFASFAKLSGHRRLALGGGLMGGFTAYDAFSEPTYGAYRWNVGVNAYFRGNVVPPKHGWPVDVVVRPYLTVGQAAVPGESAFEVSGGAVVTVQLRKQLE
jgi:outer membrane murein-binding lipoprotein Lpp